MIDIPFIKGLYAVKDDIYAYLQPDGAWGLSNAGLVVKGNQALLIDTLYDYGHTREMIDAIYQKLGDDVSFDYVINTHANGDHYYGNALFGGAVIISSDACREEMKTMPPSRMNLLMRTSWLFGKAGGYAKKVFSRFNFSDIELSLPTRTFSGTMTIDFGKSVVELIEVGPAHTKGDIIVHLPGEKVVFASDILFIDMMPIFWEGSIENLIKACDLILGLEPDAVVPGHGPVTDKKGVEKMKEFYLYLYDETRKRYDRGMSVLDAALDIDLEKYAWSEKERVAANVAALYCELEEDKKGLNPVKAFEYMARYKEKKGGVAGYPFTPSSS
ncbi:MAG: MBL fold metallo-hydrolase [Spirochaetales bacterium]|nr:MBL fold metallo-hydrolase [Spirochaetales bacterium]